MLTTGQMKWQETDERPGPRVIPPEPVGDVILRTEEPNAVAWLVVLGAGTWGYADSRCRMRTYPAGLHRISQETVDFALRAGSNRLIVTVEEPKVTVRGLTGPLSPQHFAWPADGSVILAPTRIALPLDDETIHVPTGYSCQHCPQSFPSVGARDRHTRLHHGG